MNPKASTEMSTPETPIAEQDGESIVCPFCGEPDFDLVGLKTHLVGSCERFQATDEAHLLFAMPIPSLASQLAQAQGEARFFAIWYQALLDHARTLGRVPNFLETTPEIKNVATELAALRAERDKLLLAAREFYTAAAIVMEPESTEDEHFRALVARDDLRAVLAAIDAATKPLVNEKTP